MSVDALSLDPQLDVWAQRSAQPPQVRSREDAERAAAEFETFFLAQVFNTLQSDLSTEPPFGGGPGENAFRSFLVEEQARAMVQAGGIGLSDRLTQEILALQSRGTR